MRFYGLTLAASALVLGACAKKDTATTDTAAMAPAAATTDTAAMAPAAGTTPAAGASTAAMAPITGTTHEVKMIGDAKGYRFEPATLTIKAGDGVKFVNVSGGPHNVAFDATSIPAAGKSQLVANMPNQATELASPFLTAPNEGYTVSFGNVAAGTYNYVCQPHSAMNMKGAITVQ
jgi:plastocyanin